MNAPGHFSLHPNVAKVEDAADARRQGFGCSRLRRILDNAAGAVSSAFPKGKQKGDYDMVDGHQQMGLLPKKFHRPKSAG